MTYVNALIPEAVRCPRRQLPGWKLKANGNAEVTGVSTINQVLPGPGPGMRSRL